MAPYMIIGFSGKAYAGKDTCGGFVDVPGKVVYKTAFAKHLKDLVTEMYGIPMEVLMDPLKKDTLDLVNGGTYREHMTKTGDLMRSRHGPNYFVDVVASEVRDMGDDVVVIITDVRYPKEVEFVRSMGGVIINVERDDCPETHAHPSNFGLGDGMVDYHITNNNSLEDLEHRVRCVVETIIQSRKNE